MDDPHNLFRLASELFPGAADPEFSPSGVAEQAVQQVCSSHVAAIFSENDAYLRSAKKDAALHAAAILKLLVTRLRQAWPGVGSSSGVIPVPAPGTFCLAVQRFASG